jgi:hypothetical protein
VSHKVAEVADLGREITAETQTLVALMEANLPYIVLELNEPNLVFEGRIVLILQLSQ